ncbi:hypothetical protein C7H83_10020 [Tetragenococcus halophilus]|uniref:Uncharacterized protein n=1 Tax=Tetragenococcus halophilus TaxID=51669 RepID=A0A3G5FKW8_TETHA|nr:hypothetical protein [Tetragenococcus halophilus]AYW50778.1 hypothetical protein C7H83_10020 [Tetragenococcus halophilus]GBD64859.1 hypothetical protein TEHD23766T_2286 [Tetragenococcus halophilus subsp. flandriensis]GMA08887.1 hypothetical protein GCM10025886_20380 [Tetragenococcus halophilus subsp. flandriensis]
MENRNNNFMNKHDVQVRLIKELGIDFHVFLSDKKYYEDDYQKIKESIVDIARKTLEETE